MHTTLQSKKGVTLFELIVYIGLVSVVTTLLAGISLFVFSAVDYVYIEGAANSKILALTNTINNEVNDFGAQDSYIVRDSTDMSVFYSRSTLVDLDASGNPQRYKTRNLSEPSSYIWAYDIANSRNYNTEDLTNRDYYDLLEIKFSGNDNSIYINKYNYNNNYSTADVNRWSIFIERCTLIPEQSYKLQTNKLTIQSVLVSSFDSLSFDVNGNFVEGGVIINVFDIEIKTEEGRIHNASFTHAVDVPKSDTKEFVFQYQRS